MSCRCAIPPLLILLAVGGARGEPESTPAAEPEKGLETPPLTSTEEHTLPPAVIKTLEALGATSGVPDGLGATWEPARAVSGQPAHLALFNAQAGFTFPVRTTADDAFFVTGSVRNLFIRGNAVYPDSQTPFPNSLSDIQGGAAYIQQLGGGQSWGICVTGGSASDQPFHSIHEATISGFAFWRTQPKNDHAWLFYIVSMTNGQIGQNVPIPGVAYESHAEKVDAIIGFPFVSVNYRPREWLNFDFSYAAFTDMRARTSVRLAEQVKAFGGFSWLSQSWFPANRADHRTQLFWYEKRLEGGLQWAVSNHLNASLTGGYAFDRYFLEARTFTLTGQNHMNLVPGPFLSFQLEFRY